jgi:hypothetical protein
MMIARMSSGSSLSGILAILIVRVWVVGEVDVRKGSVHDTIYGERQGRSGSGDEATGTASFGQLSKMTQEDIFWNPSQQRSICQTGHKRQAQPTCAGRGT